VLAWRLLHDQRLLEAPSWVQRLYPGAPLFDRDPIALVLAALATGLALAYLACGLAGATTRVRLRLIAAGALLLVVLPTLAFVALGVATGRPYGQDGGVVQLPIAIEKILRGESPYGADYSSTMLGRQARVSTFWEPLGGNPILRHHAYLPGTHLVMLPGYTLARAVFGFFDPRLVTLVFYGLAIALAFRVPARDEARLCAAGLCALNPLTWWQQLFGANDVVFVAMILAAILLARSDRPLLAAGMLGLACGTKQLAWPFAPFLLAHLSGARTLRELVAKSSARRAARPLLVAGAAFLLVVAPVAALDPAAFWSDIVKYNVGLPGDNYPLGGTPGFGFANFLIGYGAVSSLKDYFPFSRFYLLLVPLGLLLLVRQLRLGRAEAVLVTGSVALLASVYLSRVVHSNYLIAAAILLPAGVLALRLSADMVLTPLALLLLGVTVAEQEVFRASWDQAVSAGVPGVLPGWVQAVLPHPATGLTTDPIGLVVSAVCAGFGLVYLAAAVLGASPRVRALLLALGLIVAVGAPAMLLTVIGARTGTPRGLDAWSAQLPADAGRLRKGESPYTPPPPERPVAREAWSSSFRLDPAAAFPPDRPLVPPGGPVVASLAGVRDPRSLLLLSLGATILGSALLAARVSPAASLAAAACGLLAPLALGTVFGARSVATVGGLTLTAWLACGGRSSLAHLALGATAAVDPLALAAAPLLALGGPAAPAASRASFARSLALLALGCSALVVPVLLLDPASASSAFLARIEAAPGVGIVSLLGYQGAVPAAVPAVCTVLVGAVVLAGPWSARVCRPDQAAGLAAFLGLAALWLHPAPPAGSLALPVALLALAAPGLAVSGERNR